MSTQTVLAIWGTGSLAQRYLDIVNTGISVDYFIDSSKAGEFAGKPVLSPDQVVEHGITHITICSTYVDDIAPVCLRQGFSTEQLSVVLPRTLERVSFEQFSHVEGAFYYYLPWTKQIPAIEHSLSSDIVFPDVYKEIAKSVAYVYVSSVEGDFAEFGTCTGYTASLIAYTMKYYSEFFVHHESMHNMTPRELCLFDSFQGFPASTKAPDLDSPHVASGAWGEGTAKGLNAKQLKQLCSQFIAPERINIYEGWYKDTLATIDADKRFAFVHLDCDLYESTYDVLYHLLSNNLLSEGAKLLFDNWYCNKASRHFGEQKAWHEICEQFDIEYTNIGMYACVGHKMIIHSYRKK